MSIRQMFVRDAARAVGVAAENRVSIEPDAGILINSERKLLTLIMRWLTGPGAGWMRAGQR